MKYAKNDFFSISTGYGIWGAQNDRTGLASIFTIEVDLPRPLSIEIWAQYPIVGQNTQKSSKFFVFGLETWGVQSNGLMVGINLGIRTD